MLYWIAWVLARPVSWFYGWRLEGYRKIKGPVIYAFNHPDGADGFFILTSMPRKIHFLAKAEMFVHQPDSWFLTRVLEQVPILRGKKKSAPAVAKMIEYAKKGDALGIFPEGMTYQAPKLREFHRGVARIALGARIPIVPCAIIGSFHMTRHDSGPYGSWVPAEVHVPVRKEVRVVFGEPMTFEEYYGKENDRRVTKLVANKVRARMRRILKESGAPPEYL